MENFKKSHNVFFIGLLSFFGGIGQDIFLPLLPIYLASLGLSKEFIGLSSGLVESAVSIFRMVSGFLTDKLKNKKAIIFAGYVFSMLGRVGMAFMATPVAILVLRIMDGIGKGVKNAPKDTLIADSTQIANRGKGFGIARALDTLGSVVGPLLLFVLLTVLDNNAHKYEYIFMISAIPLIATLLIIVFKVKETQPKALQAKTEKALAIHLPKKFYIFLRITILFSLGNPSDTFLILRAQNVGLSIITIPLVYALFNFIYAAASIPLGSLSDKIGREKVIIIGWVAYALAYLGFGLANQSYQIWLLFAFYGVYSATTEGVAKALIADIIDPEHRGRAYGIYNTCIGLIALPAAFIGGFLWDKINSSAPFLFGAGIATIASICLFVFIRLTKVRSL